MIFLDDEIEQALRNDKDLLTLLGGDYIYEFYEAGDRDISYPRIIFEEIGNVPATENDNQEKMSRITYRISVCAETKLLEIVNAVERIMISISFVRQSCNSIRDLPLGIGGKVMNFITIRETK